MPPAMTELDEQSLAWLCLEEVMPPEWLDANEHINVQFYFHMAAHAIYELMESILMGGVRSDPAPLFFTLTARISYKAELHKGDRVRVYIRPLSRSEKTLNVLIRIFRVGENAALSAEMLWKGAYVDRESRRVQPLSDQSKAIFDAMLRAASASPYEAVIYPPGRELPPPLQPCISFRGRILPEWIDRMGHMGIEHFQLLFDRATRGYFDALGMTLEFMRGNGWGAFGMGSDIQYLKEMKLGDPFHAVTRMISIQRKTCTFRHEVWLEGETPQLAVTCDHTSIYVDWKTRRAIPLPEVFLRRIGELHGPGAEAASPSGPSA